MSRRKTKSSTRVRVTRIAAAAVIATGASLTAVGAAQAVTNDGGGVSVNAKVSLGEGTILGVTEGASGETTGTPGTSGETTGTPGTSGETTGTPGTSGETTGTPGTSGQTTGTPGTSGQTTSGSNGNSGGNGNTCTLTGDSVDCGNNNTSTDNTKPVTQNKSTNQLAETGSNGTTFMIIGAATLIAGGVGFRLTPRLVNRRTTA